MAAKTDERGGALPTTLILLIILGLVAAAAAFTTVGDARVGELYASSSRGEAAAAAGIEHGVEVYHQRMLGLPNDDDVDEYLLDGAWPVTGTIDGFDYTVTVARDSFDYDGDAVAGPVSFDATQNDAYNEDGEGFPVHRLTSVATRGDHSASQMIRVVQNVLNPTLSAALTLNTSGDVRFHQQFAISGINSRMDDGTAIDSLDTSYTGACDENKPALRLTKPHHLKGEPGDGGELDIKDHLGSMSGNLTFQPDDPPYVVIDEEDEYEWESIEDVLQVPLGSLDRYQKSPSEWEADLPDSLSGITYITGSTGNGTGACLTTQGCGHIDGSGVLIVHNPLYNPREHDPADPEYDESKADDPLYAPASMGNIDGGTFRGIVIVDELARMDSGPFTILGAVLMLAQTNHVNRTWIHYTRGLGTMRWSCEAVEYARYRGAPLRLSWSAD